MGGHGGLESRGLPGWSSAYRQLSSKKEGMWGWVWGRGESRRSTGQSRQFEVKTEKRNKSLGEAYVGLRSALQSQGRIEAMLTEQTRGREGGLALRWGPEATATLSCPPISVLCPTAAIRESDSGHNRGMKRRQTFSGESSVKYGRDFFLPTLTWSFTIHRQGSAASHPTCPPLPLW